jgi:hypothetical protein
MSTQNVSTILKISCILKLPYTSLVYFTFYNQMSTAEFSKPLHDKGPYRLLRDGSRAAVV